MVLPYEIKKSWVSKVKHKTKRVANKTFLKRFLKSRKVSNNEGCLRWSQWHQVVVVITTAYFHLTNLEFKVLCNFKSCLHCVKALQF